MAYAGSQNPPVLPTAAAPPAAPPGMVAVPAAALLGRQQHAAQQAGTNIGVMAGVVEGSGGNMWVDAAVGGYVGQQVGRYQRQAAMHDPNAPMVYVDENSRAGRRAVRRAGRKERRQGGGWLSRFFGGKKAAEEKREEAEAEAEDESAREGPAAQAKVWMI